MDIRIILQARLSSTRLPGKCLLPIGGYPLVVLSALRAANTGLPLVLATSTTEEDGILARTAEEHGIRCVRGSLEDVFGRFLLATEDLPDDAWVVRLTGDNCFPDGTFVEALVAQADSAGCDYLGTSSPDDGFPYGLSAEVFRVKALRAVAGDLSAFDREHVTPAIKRAYGARLAEFEGPSHSHLRCTIDTKTDYFRMLSLLSEVKDPISVPWADLCEQLAGEANAPSFRIPWLAHKQGLLGKLTLGTAQLGLPSYGRVNKSGKPADKEAFRLLDTAVRYGITHLDTASAYGDAESRIAHLAAGGLYTEPTVITKLDPLDSLPDDASEGEIVKWVEAAVFRSAHALQKKVLPVLMLHRWSHYRAHGGLIWKTLEGLKEAGVIGRLGASVYHPEEAIEALKVPLITDLQIPFNLLDHRWRSGAFAKAKAARADAVVYSRSAYLQGLLVSDPEHWPQRSGFDANEWVSRIEAIRAQLNRESRADLCIAYLMATPLVDSIVIGVETVKQLEENLKLSRLPELTRAELEMVEDSFTDAPEWLLDPSQWN
ncbi:MAG: aldo/keto reductase [Opitutaceae bacterium]